MSGTARTTDLQTRIYRLEQRIAALETLVRSSSTGTGFGAPGPPGAVGPAGATGATGAAGEDGLPATILGQNTPFSSAPFAEGSPFEGGFA